MAALLCLFLIAHLAANAGKQALQAGLIPIGGAHRAIHMAAYAIPEWPCFEQPLADKLVAGPARQGGDTQPGGSHLQHDRGVVHRLAASGLHPGRLQEAAEHIHPGALHRVDQQYLLAKIFWCDARLPTERVIRCHHHGEIEGEQRFEMKIAAGLHVLGEQQIELAAEQGGQGIEARHRLHLQIHPWPLAAKIRQQRQQPLDAAVAIERQVQATGVAAVQGL